MSACLLIFDRSRTNRLKIAGHLCMTNLAMRSDCNLTREQPTGCVVTTSGCVKANLKASHDSLLSQKSHINIDCENVRFLALRL